MKNGTKRDIFAISFMILVTAFILGGSAYIEAAMTEGVMEDVADVRAEQKEIPIYIILKEPILVQLKGDTAMVYKIRSGVIDITNHGMVNVIPYHKVARDLLGDHLRIPMYNIKCIVTGDNKIKGHMWE